MKKQNGFTLIETLVVVGLSGVILIGAVLSIFQILQNTNRSNSHVEALDDIGRVLLQVKRDLQSYQTGNFTDLQDGPTILEWTNLSGFEPVDEREHYVIYILEGNTLYREADNITSILGRRITSVVFTEGVDSVDVSITSTSDNFPPKSETFEFTMYSRSITLGEDE